MNLKVITLKTASGEETIGQHVTTAGGIVQLKSPLKVDRMMSDGGLYYTTRAWFMAQFEGYEEKTVGINTNQIVAQFLPGDEAVKQYFSTIEYLCSPSDTADMSDSDEIKIATSGGNTQIH